MFTLAAALAAPFVLLATLAAVGRRCGMTREDFEGEVSGWGTGPR